MANTKSIFSALKSSFTYLESEKSSKENKRRLEVLTALKDFIYTGCYTTYKNKEVFLQNEELKDTILAQKLGISVGGVRQARKRISQDAYSALGLNVTDLILYGTDKDCDSVIMSIKVLSYIYMTKTFMFNEVLDKLKDSYIGDNTEVFELSDCRLEMLFLRFYTIQQFTTMVGMLNSDKLNYLVNILEGDSDSSGIKLKLLKYLHLENSTDMDLLFTEFSKKMLENKLSSKPKNNKENEEENED